MLKNFKVSPVASPDGLIALLDEPSLEIKNHALRILNDVVMYFWPEISDVKDKIEALAKDLAFPHHTLAALLASKLYFNLGKWEESIDYALLAGIAFDVHDQGEYVQTVLSKTVDRYIKARREALLLGQGRESESSFYDSGSVSVDPVLEQLVDRMVQGCMKTGEWRPVIGIAIEALRLDILEAVLDAQVEMSNIPYYTADLAMQQPIRVRNEVLKLIVQSALKYFNGNPDSAGLVIDWVFVADCLLLLSSSKQNLLLVNEFTEVARVLSPEIRAQIMMNYAMITGVNQTVDQLPINEDQGKDLVSDRYVPVPSIFVDYQRLAMHFLMRSCSSDLVILNQARDSLNQTSSMLHAGLSLCNALMHAGTTRDDWIRQNMDWMGHATLWTKFTATASLGLIHRGQKDRRLMDSYLPPPGVAFGAQEYSEGGALLALALMNQEISRDYLMSILHSEVSNEPVLHGLLLGLGLCFIGKAEHQVDHGTIDQIKGILYKDQVNSGEAAAICLGLLYSGTPQSNQIVADLFGYAHETQHDRVVRALGMACALICYGQGEAAHELAIDMLLSDQASELRYGGAWAVALAYAGTGSRRATSLLLHLAVTDASDDVRRVAVIGLGLIMSNCPTQLPSLLDLLIESFNPHVRYGAAMALGIAFASSGDQEAQELLQPLQRDKEDFVRQARCIALAMINQLQPSIEPETKTEKSSVPIKKATNDTVQAKDDEVKELQGGEDLKPTISESTPKSKTEESKPSSDESSSSSQKDPNIVASIVTHDVPLTVWELRHQFRNVLTGRHESQVHKLGALLALGIIDAGGRNQAITLLSHSPALNSSLVIPRPQAMIGMALFCQYWFWFPFALCLGLTFSPVGLIAVSAKGHLPVDLGLSIDRDTFKKHFAYPAPLKQAEQKTPQLIESAVLSVTAKKKSLIEKLQLSKTPLVITSTSTPPVTTPVDNNNVMQVDEEAGKGSSAAFSEEKPGPMSINNMTRVTPKEWSHINANFENSHFIPATQNWKSSERIIILRQQISDDLLDHSAILQLQDPQVVLEDKTKTMPVGKDVTEDQSRNEITASAPLTKSDTPPDVMEDVPKNDE